MGAALLVHNRSSASISDCIFLHNILEMKPNKVYQALDGRLIAELSRARSARAAEHHG